MFESHHIHSKKTKLRLSNLLERHNCKLHPKETRICGMSRCCFPEKTLRSEEMHRANVLNRDHIVSGTSLRLL